VATAGTPASWLSHLRWIIAQWSEAQATGEAGMDREQFWALIEAAKAATSGDCRAQTAHLIAALRERSVSDVLDYDRIHDELMAESYRLELWGAAYLINGAAPTTASTTSVAGCSARAAPSGRPRWLTRTRWRRIRRCELARRSRSGLTTTWSARASGGWPGGRMWR
jgi:Protein of unknown function (DUF4240)